MRGIYDHAPPFDEDMDNSHQQPSDASLASDCIAPEHAPVTLMTLVCLGAPILPPQHFTERKARMCFAYAKPVIGDEFGNINRFMEMTFFDFIEALGHSESYCRHCIDCSFSC